MTWSAPQWKPSRTARKAEERKRKKDRQIKEKDAKAEVRKRDLRRCRFPLCGCRKTGEPLEASHSVQHKGMGGNPAGDRSTTDKMVLLCKSRHQDSVVSVHRGTLVGVPLTNDGYDGPVAWMVDVEAVRRWNPIVARPSIFDGRVQVELARERAVQELEPLEDWQRTVLLQLAKMEA